MRAVLAPLFLAILLLLSGCSGGSGKPASLADLNASSTSASDGGRNVTIEPGALPKLVVAELSFQGDSGITLCMGQGDCGSTISANSDASFQEPVPGNLTRVNVTLTWSAQTPLSEEFTLRVRSTGTGVWREATGPSPLSLGLDTSMAEGASSSDTIVIDVRPRSAAPGQPAEAGGAIMQLFTIEGEYAYFV